jgi:pimeloyl-ACP methyl ester carboxylesterase
VLPALAARHDVVAVDLPGFGDSAVPERFNSEQAVRTVVVLMDRLGITRASLVGNSMGGAIAVVIAARTPERVDRLVLVDAAGYNFKPADRPWILRLVAAVPAGVAEALPLRRVVTLALRQVFHDRSLVTAERVAEYVAPLRRPGAVAVVRQILLSEDAMGFPEVVRGVHAPTLVVWGRYDAWVDPRDAERFAADIRGARVVLVESGHMPQEERPAETAALISDFLDAQAGTRTASAVSKGPRGGMAMSKATSLRVFGALNILVGALDVWGGGQEAVVYWREAPLNVAVGSAGALAGILLAVSGVKLWRQAPSTRVLVLAASAAMIAAHLWGALLGIMGLAVIVVGIVYPAVLLTWVRRNLPGAPGAVSNAASTRGDGENENEDVRRMTTATA